VVVGARPQLVAVNCNLDTDDLPLARDIAAQVRERDGGLPGVRALGLGLASRSRAQVSMNVTRLAACGVERACTAVRRLAYEGGADVEAVELVGLVPAAELERCSPEFLTWSRIGPDHTIEAHLTRSGERGPSN
jgi:glutamate formiminotransferase